ncbi:MAG: hypothetical protein GX038_00770 [Erysipelothrix sp.]|nr:hypothetical protein [Erysipelothrix sp.]
MEKYALIGDIINSKNIKERDVFQKSLSILLGKINEKYSESIASNLTLTLGDEFQGLFDDIETLFLVTDIITLELANLGQSVRFGIGYGTLLTSYNKEISIGADGEAYWNARKAIDHVYHNNHTQRVNEHYVDINEKHSYLINSTIKIQNSMRYNWTHSQRNLVLTILKDTGYGPINTTYIKNILKISSSSLSNRSTSSSYTIYVDSRKHLSEYIKDNENKD